MRTTRAIRAPDYYPRKLIAWYFIKNHSLQLISLQHYPVTELKHTSNSWQEIAVMNTLQSVLRERQAQVMSSNFFWQTARCQGSVIFTTTSWSKKPYEI
jgi:hypothetical protein